MKRNMRTLPTVIAMMLSFIVVGLAFGYYHGSTRRKPAPAAQKVVQEGIEIVAKEFGFTPGAFRVTPDTVTFSVTNGGNYSHGFVIEGPGLKQAIQRISPGATATLQVTFTQTGDYRFYCPIAVGNFSHREAGMEGKLTVQ